MSHRIYLLKPTILVTQVQTFTTMLEIEILPHGIYDANNSFTAAGADVTFTGAGFLKLGGATVTSIGSNFTAGNGTVEYDYAGDQNIKTRSYYNLILDNGVKKTIGNTIISNDVTITSDGTLDIGTGDDNLTIGGNFSNSGTFTTSGETITNDSSPNLSLMSLRIDTNVRLIPNPFDFVS